MADAFDSAMKAQAAVAPAPESAQPPQPITVSDGVPPKPPAYTEKDSAVQTSTNSLAVRYIGISANQEAIYLLRSDGIIDRSTGGGKVTRQLIAPAPHTFTAVSAGHSATYALRSDGCVYRTKSGVSPKSPSAGEIRPPPDLKYVAVGAGPHASYLLRSDGKIDRTVSSGKIERVMEPDGFPVVQYSSISAGYSATYLLRTDGKVDRVKSGNVSSTMEVPGKKYIAVFPQLTWTHSNGQTTYTDGSYAIYLLLDDGTVVRTVRNGEIDKTYTAPAGTYIRGASGEDASYLITSTGLVQRLRGKEGKVKQTEDPNEFDYLEAAAGESAVYLLRSDGLVDRSKSELKVSQTMVPPSQEEVKKNASCNIM